MIETVDTPQFDVVRNVTKEFFVVPEDGTPMFLKFQTAFATDPSLVNIGRRSKNDDPDKPKEPIEVADVLNLQTGEEGRIIGNSVIKSELRSSYPDESYVNKYFRITQGAMKQGKSNKYRSFKIIEIKIREKSEPVAETHKATNKK